MDKINDESAPEFAPESPCIRNCCLDGQDICLGCGRSLSEITEWSLATDEAKRAILRAAAGRRDARAEKWKGIC